MKRFCAYFLSVLVLMPSLACAMSACPFKTSFTPAAEEQPHCPEHDGTQKTAEAPSPEASPNQAMVLADCLGLDIQQTNHSLQIEKPDFSLDLTDSFVPETFAISAVVLQKIYPIRGSPYLSAPPHHSSPIYLVTQRLRI